MNGCLRSPAAYRVLDIMHGLDHVHLERRHAYASARNDAWRFGTLAYVGTIRCRHLMALDRSADSRLWVLVCLVSI